MTRHRIAQFFRASQLREVHRDEFLAEGLHANEAREIWILNSRITARGDCR